MKWTIGIITVLFVIFFSGCSNTDDKPDYYGGLKKTDLPDLNIVKEYRGHGDYWGVIVFIYKDSPTTTSSRVFFVYNGKDEKPAAISVDYEVGDEVGSWGTTYNEIPENGIYPAAAGGNFVPKDEDSTIKFSIKSNHSEFIELKAVY